MADLHLTAACGDYDHIRDIALGRVKPQGIDLTLLNYDVEEIFYRFADRGEWDVSEMSMGMFCSQASRPQPRMIGLPVFTSRAFRHSAFYVHADGKVKKPGDLSGRRVGVPQWSQTAGVYARGILTESVGIPLAKIKWVQGGVNIAGRVEPAAIDPPAGVDIVVDRTRSLNDLLLEGAIDAIITARPPKAFTAGDPRIVRLWPDSRAAEEAWHRETGIFPIMHTVVIKREIFERHRWVAKNLYVAFDEAKNRSIERMLDATASHTPVPWGFDSAQAAGRLVFGNGPLWPYGVEANRVTIDAFLRFCFEQGVCARRLAPEELFPEEVRATIRV